MITISLCMIVKNEQDVLARCLDSVHAAADEIIIVDTGSGDATKQIAARYTDKIYDFEWIDDFAAARNYAFSKASMDYQLWLDADDVLLPADLQKLLQLKQSLLPQTAADIYMFKYHTSFDEKGQPTFSFFRERLLKREKNFRWQDRVHECIPISGSMQRLDIAVTHKKEHLGRDDRNLNIYRRMEEEGCLFSPRNLYYYGRELYDHRMFAEAAEKFDLFLDGKQGWLEDNIEACAKCYICRMNIGQAEQAELALLRSFTYAAPRPKACTMLGQFYSDRGEFSRAVFWYELAIRTAETSPKEGFYEQDFDLFLPSLGLCVCYDRLGEREKARSCHETSKLLKPEHKAVQHNESYFAALE